MRDAEAANDERNEKFEFHVARCAECGNLQKISARMQKFAADTAALPLNLPAPGLILFKARLLEKQSAVERATQPIIKAQIASAIIFAAAICWLLVTGKTIAVSVFTETFRGLLTVAPLIVLAAVGAGLICLAFAYFLRGIKEFKK